MSDEQRKLTEDQEAEIAAFVQRLNDFASGASHSCPNCGAEVTGAIRYDRIEPDDFSLYVQPCNCRFGSWSKVPAWITDVDVVPFEEFDVDDDDIDWNGEYEPDELDEALALCGMMHDGICSMAGSEYCDWECPFRMMNDDDGFPYELFEDGEG